MAHDEMGGVVFVVVFIVLFSTLLSTIPAGLQGPGQNAEYFTPLDPAILTDFADGVNWTKSGMSEVSGLFYYPSYPLGYELGAYDWLAGVDNTSTWQFALAAKIYALGFIWLGQYDAVKFVSPTGTNRGTVLSIDEIEADATDGVVRYTLTFETSGNSAGGFVFYWNETLYSDPYDAWTNDNLQFVHGIGLEDTISLDIGSLLLGLLLFNLPDVPALIGIPLGAMLWAAIAYLVWWIAISMIPFLGGA
jgi:hypothetical protein